MSTASTPLPGTDEPMAAVRDYIGGFNITQTGATFTVALRRLSEGWRLAAWAWTKGTAQQA